MEDNQPEEKSEEDKLEDKPEKTTDDQSKKTTQDKEDKDNKDDTKDSKEEPEKDSEQKEEEGKSPAPELTKDDIIKILKTFSGVGQVIAERIYETGFDNREKLKAVTAEDLKKIDGVGQVMAEDLAANMESAIKKFDEPEKKEEPKKEAKGITDKAIGFVKGTISKITGFFKGKSPKSKPKAEEPKVSESGKVKPETNLKSESAAAPGDLKSTKEGAGEETYFPEVGSPKEEIEEKPKHESVSIESSDTELGSELLEPEIEVKKPAEAEEPMQKPELVKKPEPESKPGLTHTPEPEKQPRINLKDSSGLLIWFEASPNLRPEAGKLLFKAGYNNLEELMEAVVEDLVLVNGINEVEAKTIYSELKKLQ